MYGSDEEKPPSREKPTQERRLSTAEVAKEFRYPSSMLNLDERVMEIRHFTHSHTYEKRVEKRASLSHARTRGLDHLKLADDVRATPKKLDGDDDPDRHLLESIPARKRWRQEVDRSCKLLLVDLDLHNDSDHMRDRAHMLRCHHVDKLYSWFHKHAGKEQSKEKQGPAFLRYDPDTPAMPGSLRIHRKPDKPKPAKGLGQSASSPALITTGMQILADTKL